MRNTLTCSGAGLSENSPTPVKAWNPGSHVMVQEPWAGQEWHLSGTEPCLGSFPKSLSEDKEDASVEVSDGSNRSSQRQIEDP